MQPAIYPETPPQLAEALRTLAGERRTIRMGGNFTKDRLGGRPQDGAATISTTRLCRLIQYEPQDLTVSVEAGMPFTELQRTLEERGQMLPLDPFTGPGWESATVGGVIGANLSGPRRRLYGTARDMVIGMTFATLEGKLVQTGGMVVKNVAGLDMGKLMIGSFGTLAAMASVNFKVFPIPQCSRTFVMEFSAAGDAFAERDRILRGQLPPAAIDIVRISDVYRLLVRATGNQQVIARFSKDLAKARAAEGDEENALWQEIREFTPRFLAANPAGGVVAIRTPLAGMREEMERLSSAGIPCIARSGSGVIHAHYATDPPPTPIHDESGMMKKIKHMFDPENLLNRGRLHGYL